MSRRHRRRWLLRWHTPAPLRVLLMRVLLSGRFTFIEQRKLKVVEMFYMVDTDGSGELDTWEFEDAVVRRFAAAADASAPPPDGSCTDDSLAVRRR